MFTGLIQAVGTVLERQVTARAARLKIRTDLAEGLRLGDSVAVNGVCLTAARLGGGWFSADVMPETWRSSNLSFLKPGAAVNLEPALALGDRLGGHLVSGHVEGIGRILRIERQNNAVLIRIGFPKELAPWIAHKGSIAVNGISLTVQALAGTEFMVSLIPHTYRETNFPGLKAGDPVNLETDLLVKYGRQGDAAVAEEPGRGKGISVEFLAEHGF
jgi:riboflavin synthase